MRLAYEVRIDVMEARMYGVRAGRARERRMMEGQDAHAREAREILRYPRALQLDEELDALRRRRSDPLERRHPLARELASLPRARVEDLDLRKRPLGDAAMTVRGLVKRVVVDDDERAVPGAVHVELDPVGAEGNGAAEARERVRGRGGSGAAVPDAERTAHAAT